MGDGLFEINTFVHLKLIEILIIFLTLFGLVVFSFIDFDIKLENQKDR